MKLFVFLISFSLFFNLSAQKTEDDEKNKGSQIFNVHVHYGLQLPEADMKLRYGINSNAGIGVSIKTMNNWVLEADFNYIFGGKVKIEDSIFAGIANPDGFILDGNGQLAEVYTYERGYYVMAGVGKILPVFQVNPNSGLSFSIGAGFLQHKIRIYNPDNTAAQVCGDYVKGYDYLSNGFALRQFIGYTFYGVQKVYSFKFGFEVVEAFTQGRRDYLFPLKGPDTEERLDVLYGFKAIYTLPFYKDPKDVQYYY